jgi:outer membrane biosynthesis protein TonB
MNSTKKPKLVRDSFTIPKSEYAAIDLLKGRAMALGRATKKSELLRAGLKVLAGMGDEALQAALANVPTLKTGRPAADPAPAIAKVTVPKTGTSPKTQPVAVPRKTATAAARRSTPAKAVTPRQTPARKAAATQKPAPGRKTARQPAVRTVR